MASPGEVKWIPGKRLQCSVCLREFTQIEPGQLTHKACQGRVVRGVASNPKELETPYKDAGYRPGDPPPVLAAPSSLLGPLRIAAFDLECFSLDRGWGIILVACIIVFDGSSTTEHVFRLDQFDTFKKDRSNDAEIAAATLSVLEDCHVLWGHNIRNFDMPYLNSVAAKYGLPAIERKLRDPVQILRAKFRIGSNSLASAADFFGLEQSKMHVPAEVWRQAAFNGSKEHFDILESRCRSDVRLLIEVARKVEDYGGTINYSGFFQR
jgi:DNA polymerase elongation subunit (family B)